MAKIPAIPVNQALSRCNNSTLASKETQAAKVRERIHTIVMVGSS